MSGSGSNTKNGGGTWDGASTNSARQGEEFEESTNSVALAMTLSSDEVNYLVFRYVKRSGVLYMQISTVQVSSFVAAALTSWILISLLPSYLWCNHLVGPPTTTIVAVPSLDTCKNQGLSTLPSLSSMRVCWGKQTFAMVIAQYRLGH